MAETFTPGPWRVESVDQGSDARGPTKMVMICADDMRIATMFSKLNREANARLIAAAPELLEHLKDMVRRFEGCLITHGTDKEFAQSATAHARAAIQKAIGQ